MNIEDQEIMLKDILKEQKKLFHPQNYYIYQNLENQRHLLSIQQPPYPNNDSMDLVTSNMISTNDAVNQFYGRRTIVDNELYQYCIKQSSSPSSYKTILMMELLNNALTEILEYQEVHQLEMNSFMAYSKQKLEAIHYHEVRSQLEKDILITFDSNTDAYNYVQDLFERFRLYLLM
ncbi:hypothetical protein PIROE2DRAFT_66894 [Piromyces sp. E2]|nr:hypothetical protein PIROE2DRAFT_66894 [Piromyces sp. E2]|eukprot:OUM68870.1 hypothetical protein PIROE2DRAFT_66894 [Piromyces sp. E2]